MEQDAQERSPSIQQRRQFKEARVEDVSHGVRYAEGGFGRPLVFFPGLAGLQITRVHHDLAERYRLMGFDVPRLREAFAGSPTLTRDLAHHLGRSIEVLGIDAFTLLGSAYGANVALQLALHAPERIRALILLAPTALRLEQRRADGGLSPSADGSLGPEIERQLAGLTLPVLVLFGVEDRVVPPETGRIYRERLPNCRYALVAGAGHALEDDQPELVASAVSDFMDRPETFSVSGRTGLIDPSTA
jgi:pimeloyl-ACP methyl ester carboxylesterase